MMDEIKQLHDRIANLERVINAYQAPQDASILEVQVRGMKSAVDILSKRIADVESRKIPLISHLATKQSVTETVRAAAEAIADQVVNEDRAVVDKLGTRIDNTIAAAAADAASAKQLLSAHAFAARDLLLARAHQFAR